MSGIAASCVCECIAKAKYNPGFLDLVLFPNLKKNKIKKFNRVKKKKKTQISQELFTVH